MAPLRPDVLIIGAGVSGLTTAVLLAEGGHPVRIMAREQPHRSTSANAGAIWDPIYAAHPDVPRWSAETYQVLSGLVAVAGTGVRMVDGVEASRTPMPSPQWAKSVPGYREATGSDLPPGFSSGWRYTAPVIDMPTYLRYLVGRLTAAGGTIELGLVTSLTQVAGRAPIVVNCTGIGARDLVPDPDVSPVRGQLVAVQNPGIKEFFAEHTAALTDKPEITYILPQNENVALLGGSAEEGNDSVKPDQNVADGIIRRCAAIVPALATAKVLGHRIGIRPNREPVRVELVEFDGTRLVHNYGHGGAGVSLSWGCAADIAAMLQEPA